MMRGLRCNSVDEIAVKRGKTFQFWSGRLAAGLALIGCSFAVFAYHAAPLVGISFSESWLPSVLLDNATGEFAETDFKLVPEVTDYARLAASGAPLEAAPFYFAALSLDEARDAARILALLDEALRRDPRHTFAHLWRARLYHQMKRTPEAVQEVARVLKLDPKHSTEYVEALVELAQNPASHPQLLELVRAGPLWAPAFKRLADERLADQEFLIALASQADSSLTDHIRSLTNKGQFERAFVIWQVSLSEEQLLSFSWPLDSRFDPGQASSAIGWQTDNDMTTREQDGLHVFYTGRGKRTAASQPILLGPGYVYSLDVAISGETEERGGAFRWSVQCQNGGPEIARLDTRDLDIAPALLTTDFAVPEEGCAAQLLSLIAMPGEQVRPARATIRSVTIRDRGVAPAVEPDGSLAAPTPDSKAEPQ